eukprot:g3.t1
MSPAIELRTRRMAVLWLLTLLMVAHGYYYNGDGDGGDDGGSDGGGDGDGNGDGDGAGDSGGNGDGNGNGDGDGDGSTGAYYYYYYGDEQPAPAAQGNEEEFIVRMTAGTKPAHNSWWIDQGPRFCYNAETGCVDFWSIERPNFVSSTIEEATEESYYYTLAGGGEDNCTLGTDLCDRTSTICEPYDNAEGYRCLCRIQFFEQNENGQVFFNYARKGGGRYDYGYYYYYGPSRMGYYYYGADGDGGGDGDGDGDAGYYYGDGDGDGDGDAGGYYYGDGDAGSADAVTAGRYNATHCVPSLVVPHQEISTIYNATMCVAEAGYCEHVVKLAPGLHTVHMNDKFGNGWQGAKWTLMRGSTVVAGPFTLENDFQYYYYYAATTLTTLPDGAEGEFTGTKKNLEGTKVFRVGQLDHNLAHSIASYHSWLGHEYQLQSRFKMGKYDGPIDLSGKELVLEGNGAIIDRGDDMVNNNWTNFVFKQPVTMRGLLFSNYFIINGCERYDFSLGFLFNKECKKYSEKRIVMKDHAFLGTGFASVNRVVIRDSRFVAPPGGLGSYFNGHRVRDFYMIGLGKGDNLDPSLLVQPFTYSSIALYNISADAEARERFILLEQAAYAVFTADENLTAKVIVRNGGRDIPALKYGKVVHPNCDPSATFLRETTGTLQLDGVTAETFETAKADIIQAIKQEFFDKYGVELDDDDIQLSGSGTRRVLSSSGGFVLQFTVKMPADLEPDPSTAIANSSTSAAPSFTVDAAAVGELVKESVQSDAVASALNVSAGALSVTTIGAPTQDVSTEGDCPAGKYVAGGVGECTSCAPGRAAPKGSSKCSHCAPGTFAEAAEAAMCKECPAGKYQEDRESTVCLSCRNDAVTLNTRAASLQECFCDQGYFDCTNPASPEVCEQDECTQCPFDAICNQSETLESLQARGDFWRAINTTNVFYQCPKLGTCTGGRIIAGNRDSQCATGYIGIRCELCDYENGYAIHQPGNVCTECLPNEGRNSVYIAVGTLCALVLAILVLLHVKLPRWLTATKYVVIKSGEHMHRWGVIVADAATKYQLNDTLTQKKMLKAPAHLRHAVDFFAVATSQRLAFENPGLEGTSLAEVITARWESASASDRQLFEMQGEEDARRFHDESQSYASRKQEIDFRLNQLYEIRLGQQQELDIPDAPKSAMQIYLQDAAREPGTARSNWRAMSAQARKTYDELARLDKERYLNEREDYQRRLFPIVKVRGRDLMLWSPDLQGMYERRVTKIKITVQFVQIALRLSSTYRFPLPPVAVSFLDQVEFLEILDVAQVPMNMDCWRHFSYINKVYVHTIMCMAIIVLLKPDIVMWAVLLPFRALARLIRGVYSFFAQYTLTITPTKLVDGAMMLAPGDYKKVCSGDPITFIKGRMPTSVGLNSAGVQEANKFFAVKMGDGLIKIATKAKVARTQAKGVDKTIALEQHGFDAERRSLQFHLHKTRSLFSCLPLIGRAGHKATKRAKQMTYAKVGQLQRDRTARRLRQHKPDYESVGAAEQQRSPSRRTLLRILDSIPAMTAVLLLVIAAVTVTAIETFTTVPESSKSELKVFEYVVTIAFVIEVSCRLYALGCRDFFFGSERLMCWLDFVVTVIDVASVVAGEFSSKGSQVGFASVLRVLRVLRFLRLLRLVRVTKTIKKDLKKVHSQQKVELTEELERFWAVFRRIYGPTSQHSQNPEAWNLPELQAAIKQVPTAQWDTLQRSASIIQSLVRAYRKNPTGLGRRHRTKHNISVLRQNMLEIVAQSKQLTREDLLLLFTYSVYTALCDTCFLFYDCQLYEDGETYLVPDPSIKCTDSEYKSTTPYVSVMSILFPFCIPAYYLYTLAWKAKALVNPELRHILKDKNYVRAFALAGRTFTNADGTPMEGAALEKAQCQAETEWTKHNHKMYTSLVGQDYKSKFESKREKEGFKQAKIWIQQKARLACVPARKYKFLWGPYSPSMFWFEVGDMLRRFLVTGLPKILTSMGISKVQTYIGLLVMAVCPVAYSSMDPYESTNDHWLMLATQLAQTIVVLCGMVRESIPGNLSNWIVTAIIMVTLVPVFVVLLTFIFDPTGKVARRLFTPRRVKEHWAHVKRLLENLAGDNENVRSTVKFAIVSIEEGDSDNIQSLMEICQSICQSMATLDEEALTGHVGSLLSAFGVPQHEVDQLLDGLGMRLFAWCLQPTVEPFLQKHGLEWDDVVPLLEKVDSVDELKNFAANPRRMLEDLAAASVPLAKKLAIMRLEPVMKPFLLQAQLSWSDVMPVLECVDSIEELKEAMEDVSGFLESKEACDHAPQADVMPVLECVDSIEELKEAMEDVSGFLERLATSGGSAAKKLAIMHLKPVLEPHLMQQGLEWADVMPVLECVDSIGELKEAVNDPAGFLEVALKADAQRLGMTIGCDGQVLETIPNGQAIAHGVQVGDVVSRVGELDLINDGIPLDIRFASLLSMFRASDEQVIAIEFNDGEKVVEFDNNSSPSAAPRGSAVEQEWNQALSESSANMLQGSQAKVAAVPPSVEQVAQKPEPVAVITRTESPAEARARPPLSADKLTQQLERLEQVSQQHRSEDGDVASVEARGDAEGSGGVGGFYSQLADGIEPKGEYGQDLRPPTEAQTDRSPLNKAPEIDV